MKCVLCHERKGKRDCKLNSGQFICSPCCADTRRTECAGCSYYETSLAYQREKQIRRKTFANEILPDVDDRCDEALVLIEQGAISQGQALLEDLRRQHPNYHMVIYGIGVCHGMRNEVDEAIACFERAVEIFPAFAHAQYNLGESYGGKFDIENAVRAYEAAIAADGSDGEVGQLARKRLDEVKAIVETSGVSLSTHLRNRRIFDRGFVALQEQRFEAAIDSFTQVVATENNHVQSYGNMGIAYARIGNRQKALECLNKALEIDPEYEPALVNRLVVERLKDGEALPGFDQRELNYYSEFKLRGKSYVQQLADELKADDK
jgi:tetratricopeptide (TPR) repeat protein